MRKYEIVFTPQELDSQEVGISAISVVQDPAIESNAVFLSSVKEYKFAQNTEEQIITGPALIPDLEILRKDEQGFYNISFSKDTIKNLAIKFFKDRNNNNTNLEHSNSQTFPATFFESWIIQDPETDKSRTLGLEKLPIGTWVVSMKVHDQSTWNNIKENGFQGFSIEAMLGQKLIKQNKKYTVMNKLEQLLNSIKSLFSDIKNIQELENLDNQLSTPEEVPTPTTETKMTEEVLSDGTKINIDDNTMEVSVINEDGSLSPLPDGDYETESGMKFSVVNGKFVPSADNLPADSQPVSQSEMDKYLEQMSEFKAELENLKSELSKKNSELSELTEKFETEKKDYLSKIENLSKEVEVLGNQPATQHLNQNTIPTKKLNFSEQILANIEKFRK